MLTTNRMTKRGGALLALAAILALCFGGTSAAEAKELATLSAPRTITAEPTLISTKPITTSGTDYPDRYGLSVPSKGGGHGGSGATMVPIIDEDMLFMVQWTRDHLNIDDANTLATGENVIVAVLDGGFNLAHPDIADNLSPLAYDAIDGDWDPEDLGNGIDDDGDGIVDNGLGHGTFVASMVRLVAPDAILLPIRVRDDEGWGFNSELHRGLYMAWKARADIVNISGWAVYEPDRRILDLIAQMRAAGIAVITSAGNDGVSQLGYLAASPDTLAVGTTDKDDILAWFSNHSFDTSPGMIFAPGCNLYGAFGFPEDTSSAYWSGTSFSAGLVTGAAALAVELDPTVEPLALYQALGLATQPAYDDQGNPLPGTGRLDVWKVVTQ